VLHQQTTELNLVPNFNHFTVVRFTAPIAGLYNISGFFQGIDQTPTTSDTHILINGVAFFTGADSEYHVPHNFLFSNFALGVGGTVDFIVGSGGNGDANDSNGLTARIEQVPEPATAGFIMFGGAVLFAVRKRLAGRSRA
jgi:hypothetical protein